jgi:hypothetical protein
MAKKTKKKSTASRATYGRYMGLVRHAKRDVKSKAKKVFASKGVVAAITYLRKHK